MNLENIPNFDNFNKINSSIPDDKVLLISDIAKMVKSSGDRFSIGFNILDEAMDGGLKEGDLMVISGISGEGKTSLSQTITYNLTKKGIACLWFSYEMTIEQLHKKFISMGIEEHYEAYAPVRAITGQLSWVKDKIKEGWIKYACKVIFIDHIDFLIPYEVKNSDSREVLLKNITTQLKSLAIELKVVIVLMAHLKKLEKDREPDMQDIGYSAGIFQIPDYVIIISREKIKNKKMGEEYGEIATNNSKIKIVKNRQTGSLKFLKVSYTNGKFIEITNQYEEPPMSRMDYLNK